LQRISRNFYHSITALLVAAFFLQSPVVFASEESQASEKKGVEAYEAGEYQKALEYFAKAIRLGSTAPSLYYDIGVTHYKLKQYAEADKAFKKVAESPKWESLAFYNRALIAYRTNQPELAEQLITISIRLSQSPGLTALNFSLRDRLENNGLAKSPWTNLVYFGFGYNDNVVLSEAGATAISGKSDSFFDVIGKAKRTLFSKDSKKLNFIVQASLRDYALLNEYDQIGLRTGFEKELRRPNSSVGVYLENDALGGKNFELISSLEYKRALTISKQNSPEFSYSFSNYYMQDNNYAYLGGIRHRIQLTKAKKLEKGSLKTYLRAEYNDREDEILSGDFYSYSPLRAGVGAVYTRNLSSRNVFTGSLYVEQSHYLDPDSRSGVFKTREDGLAELRLSFAHVTPKRWVYRANYVRTDNTSNYSEFSYSQNIVSFEILKAF
jgi:tetratricopeptide (TPR) repeat protein